MKTQLQQVRIEFMNVFVILPDIILINLMKMFKM